MATVDYSSNATDLSAQVLALKQANPDAILCDSYIGDAPLFVQTLKAQGYTPKMIVAKANGFTDPAFISNLGSNANGVASVVEFNPDLINGREFNEEFKAQYIRLTSIADYNRISTESENGDNLPRTNETGTARSDRK